MLQKIFSIHHHIFFKFICYPSFTNSKSSLQFIRKIWLNSRNVLTNVTGCFIKQSTKKPNHLTQFLISLANHHGTSAGKKNTMIFSICGKWFSKPQIWKDNNSLTYETLITISLNPLISKAACGLNFLVILTLYVQKWWEQLWIILQ